MIEWDPADKEEVLYVAVPLLSVPVPKVVVPSLNVIVPVAAEGVTMAVNVTEVPYVEGLADEVTATVEFALFTTWFSTDEVLVL